MDVTFAAVTSGPSAVVRADEAALPELGGCVPRLPLFRPRLLLLLLPAAAPVTVEDDVVLPLLTSRPPTELRFHSSDRALPRDSVKRGASRPPSPPPRTPPPPPPPLPGGCTAILNVLTMFGCCVCVATKLRGVNTP